ncbi:hypothetical protein FIBSPDRAFT_921759 [Athelia psychrophila]|uniref:RBR-type E3 ubiquitin transferase n=1 Tax=Athelia psychrophila TaxID=1759441 RepID=A0A166BSQ8_9AGAM|nr:hypothetical protein FIBSPDRAFT_921759 [Fibularhizoctonia sp. CBS 109695]
MDLLAVEALENLNSRLVEASRLDCHSSEITSICSGWTSDRHLDVEDIQGIPIFDKALRLVQTKYGRPGANEFEGLLRELQEIPLECVAIITRPPEIISCVKITISGKDVFAIFDSHSRPDYPDGSGLILSTSVSGTAARLASILPLDPHLLELTDMQWQVQLLANYSGHVFVPQDFDSGPEALTQSLIDSSLKILELQAEIFDLKSRNSALVSKNKRHEADVKELRGPIGRRRARSKQRLRISSDCEGHLSDSSQETISSIGHSPTANKLHMPGSRTHHRDCQPRPTSGPSTSQNIDIGAQIHIDKEEQALALALRKQKQYDEEDLNLRAQRSHLLKLQQRFFKCGVCFDEQREDFIARLQPCGHEFCRDCIKGHVGSKLEEHRFPVICPSCMTSQMGEPGVISNHLAQQIGLTEAQFSTWTELEMVEFSVLLHCRRCKQSGYVDRLDFEEAGTLACPFSECNHIWCKSCQQAIAVGGPQHSCDGSSELASLMKQRGWKHCPSCKTPFMKETGCNHMTCMSPGCNTHFCYVCGDLIIRSALRREVQAATSAHYRTCRLFEDVPDRALPP